MNKIGAKKIENLFSELKKTNLKRGYFLNADENFTKDLLKGLLINEQRYGYQACPCRLATGVKAKDLDIICPCNYRDADVLEYDSCFCGLYVSEKIFKNSKLLKPIPERRPKEKERQKMKIDDLRFPIWRCSVCGYICARNDAPEICPICGANHDRFEKFIE